MSLLIPSQSASKYIVDQITSGDWTIDKFSDKTWQGYYSNVNMYGVSTSVVQANIAGAMSLHEAAYSMAPPPSGFTISRVLGSTRNGGMLTSAGAVCASWFNYTTNTQFGIGCLITSTVSVTASLAVKGVTIQVIGTWS